MIENGALPIVLLPGLDGTGLLLAELRTRLSERRPAHIIDYPTDRPLGYSELARHVQDRLPAGRFILLGESFSGPLSIQLAADMPERVAALILVATFGRQPIPLGPGLAKIWRAIGSPMPHWAVAAVLMGGRSTPTLRNTLKNALARVSKQVIDHRIAEVMRTNQLETLRQVRCPIAYIRGENDLLVRSPPLREIQQAAPNVRIMSIGGPHMLLATNAAESAAAIEALCSTPP